MIRKPIQLKAVARQSLSGGWSSAAIFTLVYYLLYYFVPTIVIVYLFGKDSDLIQLIVDLALFPFAWAYWVMFLDVARTGNRCSVGFLYSAASTTTCASQAH